MTILVVEDNPADLYLIKLAIHAEAPQCTVVAAQDGDVAIRYLSLHRPDLVILDWNIPRRSGLDVLSFIRSDNLLAGLVVVIFSSAPRAAIEDCAAAADALIQKPFDLDCFLLIGKQALECLERCALQARSAGQD